MFLVQLGRVVVAGEDGPYYGERPDVSMEIEREGRQELGALDLSVVDEGGHDVEDVRRVPETEERCDVVTARQSLRRFGAHEYGDGGEIGDIGGSTIKLKYGGGREDADGDG